MRVLTVGFPLLYLPLTYGFGQGLHLFWLSGSVMAITVNFVLRKTAIGVALGIPKVVPPAQAPLPMTFTTRHDAVQGLSPARLAKASRDKHSTESTTSKKH
jgi:hypothetical protein